MPEFRRLELGTPCTLLLLYFIVVCVMALLQYSQGFDLLDQTLALTSQIIIVLSVVQPREFIILSA